MASGSFHDSGSHSGSFHSSGGGGSFGGGGSSFGGGGGGGSYSGGSYSDGDGDDAVVIFCYLAMVVIGAIFTFFVKLFQNEIPGLNVVNFIMFLVSGGFLIKSLSEYRRTKALSDYKYPGMGKSLSYIWKGDSVSKTETDTKSWYGYNKCYFLAFYDSDFGDENVNKAFETMKSTPKILWISPYWWLTFSIICFISTFFFYETVIPFFEHAIMTDFAFAFFDVLVFYLPALLSLAFSIGSFVIAKVKDNLMYECTVRAVNDNKASINKLIKESEIDTKLSSKWYYNICPNCGASPSLKLRNCDSCGSSLEVDFSSGITPPAVHRISSSTLSEKARKLEKRKDAILSGDDDDKILSDVKPIFRDEELDHRKS